MRPDGRAPDALRPVSLSLGVQKDPAGSVEIHLGQTRVLCAATVQNGVPDWLRGRGNGWITAEYAMLPGAVPNRARRDGGSRAREIQRLIGRSLRAAFELDALGERTITVDCDVLQADGGTRVAAITGGFVAVSLAVESLVRSGAVARAPRAEPVAAVACAIVDGEAVLDPCFDEDHRAEVDANFVLTSEGSLVEVQCTAERKPFSGAALEQLLALARRGAVQLEAVQREALRRRA